MSITAIVENGVIQLPPGIHLPNGTKVRIEPESSQPTTVVAERSPFAWMNEFIGSVDTLPADFAAEHDHYIHGTPKRDSK
ncbi:MAG TPA: hypothetical protein VGH90_00890 [Chthoniobacteraceae bacterium]|jgi:hypothetical protein